MGGGGGLVGFKVSDHIITLTCFSAFTILFSMFFQIIRHWAEHKMEQKPHVLQIMHEVFTELSSLGLVSFIVYLLEMTGAPQAVVDASLSTPSKDKAAMYSALFHHVHMILFCVIIVYLASISFLLCLSSRKSKKWDRFEGYTHSKHVDMFEEGMELSSCKRCCIGPKNVEGLLYSTIKREFFLKFKEMDESRANLDFQTYLTYGYHSLSVEMVSLHWSTWVVTLLFMGLNLVRTEYLSSHLDHFYESVILLSISLFTALCTFALYRRTQKVMRLDVWDFTKVKKGSNLGANFAGNIVFKRKVEEDRTKNEVVLISEPAQEVELDPIAENKNSSKKLTAPQKSSAKRATATAAWAKPAKRGSLTPLPQRSKPFGKRKVSQNAIDPKDLNWSGVLPGSVAEKQSAQSLLKVETALGVGDDQTVQAVVMQVSDNFSSLLINKNCSHQDEKASFMFRSDIFHLRVLGVLLTVNFVIVMAAGFYFYQGLVDTSISVELQIVIAVASIVPTSITMLIVVPSILGTHTLAACFTNAFQMQVIQRLRTQQFHAIHAH